MERFINVAGAQLGPIARNETRQHVVSRLLELMREAKALEASKVYAGIDVLLAKADTLGIGY
jgi:hypothetical protein